MRQLVQLQENYEAIRELDAEVIVVFREDQDGAAGLEKSREHADAEFPLLSDLGTETSSAYSGNGFQTYIIDHEGVIRAAMDGTLRERPMSAEIMDQLGQLADD